jgi:hypothetical protein
MKRDRERRVATACGLFAVLTFASTLVGCVTASTPVALEYAHGAMVAVESIDGPPQPVIEGLVRALNAEAGARGLVIVPRRRQANYRIRGYLAAGGDGGVSSIAWAWDVYDDTRRRAFRLTGAEPSGRRGAWAAADQALLRRIAQASIEELAAFIAADRARSGVAAAAVAPQEVPAATAFATPGR